MKIIRLLLIYFVIVGTCSASTEDLCPTILNYIEENLPTCGVLRDCKGFIYVDVDDDYIHKLITFLEEDGYIEPPYFGPGRVGAHITVASPKETQNIEIEECGEEITFTPTHCNMVHPPIMVGVDLVFFIVVEAPQLHEIRKKYHLPEMPYEFHITVGVLLNPMPAP